MFHKLVMAIFLRSSEGLQHSSEKMQNKCKNFMSSKEKTSSKDKDFIFSRPGGQSVSRSEIVFYALLRWLESDSFHINQSKLNSFFYFVVFLSLQYLIAAPLILVKQ